MTAFTNDGLPADEDVWATQDPPQEPDAFDRAVTALLGELLDTDGLDTIPRLEPVIEGFLYRDTLARIIGPSGHMKSFVALDFAARSADRPFAVALAFGIPGMSPLVTPLTTSSAYSLPRYPGEALPDGRYHM